VSYEVVAVDEWAGNELRRPDLPRLAARVRALVGLELTAYLTDAPSVAEYVTSLERGYLGNARVRRLEVTLEFAAIFRRANVVTQMRAWLREPDDELKGQCPAELIRESKHDETVADLRAAAERYVSRAHPVAA
jgi:hypothetical protein